MIVAEGVCCWQKCRGSILFCEVGWSYICMYKHVLCITGSVFLRTRTFILVMDSCET